MTEHTEEPVGQYFTISTVPINGTSEGHTCVLMERQRVGEGNEDDRVLCFITEFQNEPTTEAILTAIPVGDDASDGYRLVLRDGDKFMMADAFITGHQILFKPSLSDNENKQTWKFTSASGRTGQGHWLVPNLIHAD